MSKPSFSFNLVDVIGADGSVDNPQTNVLQAIAAVMVGVGIMMWGAHVPLYRCEQYHHSIKG